MSIPRIIHQLWKNDEIPSRWRDAAGSVRRYHKGWEYRLWTDELMDRHVRVNHPEFYKVFSGLNRHIMRVDVFRYMLMNDFGGLYCDLDYEFVRPFDYSNADVVLSLEYDEAYGDDVNQIANYVFASVPGHDLWKDLIASIQTDPPFTASPLDVCIATGPWFVTARVLREPGPLCQCPLVPEACLEPAPRSRSARAQDLRQQRHHVRLPSRLGLLARPLDPQSPETPVAQAARREAAAGTRAAVAELSGRCRSLRAKLRPRRRAAQQRRRGFVVGDAFVRHAERDVEGCLTVRVAHADVGAVVHEKLDDLRRAAARRAV